MNGVVSFIVSGIESYVNDYVASTLKDLVQRKKRDDFIQSIQEKVSQYCNDNQSSYLDSQAFIDFWECGKPYAKIIQNQLDISNPYPFNTLLSEIIREAKDCAKKYNRYWSIDDERVIRELCSLVEKEFNFYISNNMDDNQRLLVSSVIRESKITQAGVSKIEELLIQIRGQVQPSPYLLIPVAEIICKKMWNGDFEEVEKLMPLVSSKTHDVETLVHVMKQLMFTQEYDESVLSTHFTKIESYEIRDCLVRNIIPLLYFKGIKIGFLEAYTKSDSLKQIVSSLDNKIYSNLYNDEVIVDSRIEKHSFSFRPELYAEERWLLCQIFAIYTYNLKAMNSSDIIATTIGESESSWLSELIVYEGKILSLEYTNASNRANLSTLKNQVLALSDLYKRLSFDYSAIYYAILLRIAILLDQGDDSQLVGVIPEEKLVTSELHTYYMVLRVNSHKASFNEVYKYCTDKNEYELLICYFSSLESSEEVLALFEKHIDLIQNHVVLFVMYLDCLLRQKRIKEVLSNVEKYQTSYDTYYEYWDVYYKVAPTEEIKRQIIEKCKSNLIKCLNIYSLNRLVERLLTFEQYDLAEKYNNELKIKSNGASHTKKYEAFILNGKNKQIDSLDMLCSIFEEYNSDVSVVNAIISLSIRNKRRLDKKYLEAAEKLNNPLSLVLASEGYASIECEDEAHFCNMRALFLTDDCMNPAFSCFLGSNMHNMNDSERDYHNVEKDTVAVLQEKNTNRIVKYAIHGRQDLPQSPCVWHGDTHMYMSDAAKIGIYNLKIGNDVNIAGLDYTLVRIEPLRSYVLRVCFEYLVKSGNGKAIKLPLKNGKLDVDAFAMQISELSGDDKDKIDWISQYRNFADVPLSIYFMSRFSNASYVEFTNSFLYDPSICIREETNNNMPTTEKVLLSFVSLLLLEQIGVPCDFLVRNNAYITESALLQIKKDSYGIIARNSQDTVASIGVCDGKLYSLEMSEELKTKLIKDAGRLVSYIERIPSIVSCKDWKDSLFTEMNMVDIIGNADYDAISISSNESYTLVVTESFIDNLARNEEIGVNTVCITNWLLSTSLDVFSLVSYAQKMVEFGCVNAITREFVTRLAAEYDNLDEEAKNKLIEAWDSLLLTYNSVDESYKSYALGVLRNLFVELTSKTDDELWNPVIHHMGSHILSMFNIKLAMRITEDGFLQIGWYQDDKKDNTSG